MRGSLFRFRLTTVMAFAVGTGGLFFGNTANKPQEQPIAFSHRLHAGDFRIACLFCHDGARRSPVAGVPSVQRCIGCHSYITSESSEIQKLKVYWDEKKPIPWTRIHKLPDFTRFNHKRHVAAGVACQNCHGPVETMDRVRQVSPLTMGWCLECHKERKAPIDCLTCHH